MFFAMKKISKYLSLLMLVAFAVCFVSCGNDDPEPVEADILYLPSNAKKDIELAYDASETFNIIKFNATGDWIAEIYPANSNFQIIESKTYSHADWLEIYPFKGSAGTWECTLFSAPNHTAQSRYAVVALVSAKSRLTFNVTQQGMPNGGGGSIVPNPGD